MSVNPISFGHAPLGGRQNHGSRFLGMPRFIPACLSAALAVGSMAGRARAAMGPGPADGAWGAACEAAGSVDAVVLGPGLMDANGSGVVTFNQRCADSAQLAQAFQTTAPSIAGAELSGLAPAQPSAVFALLSETTDSASTDAVPIAFEELNLHALFGAGTAVAAASGLPRDAAIQLFFTASPLLASGPREYLLPPRRSEYRL